MSSIDGNVAMWAVTIVSNAVMGIVLARNTATTSKLNRAEDQRRQDITAIKTENASAMQAMASDNHNLTTKLLDERDRRISHSLANHAQQVANAMTLLTEHVKTSDQRFQALAAVSPKLELELVKTLSEAREFVRASAASKTEFDRFCEQSGDERREINKSINELERKVVTVEDLKKVIQEIRREG